MRKFVSIIAIAAMMLATCACGKQEQPDDSGKMSDLLYFVESLVRTDKAGNITGYIVGDNLNEANPWEISVPVSNYDEAVAIFRGLLPAGAQVTTSGKTLIWTMTDEEGKPEGTAEFAEDPGLGAIAAVTIKPILATKAVSRADLSVHFILTSTWPQNAGAAEEILEKDYYLGSVVYLEKDLGYGDGEFLVIRTWKPTEAGIMIRLAKVFDSFALCSIGTLHKVYDALQANYNLFADYAEDTWPSLDRWYWSSNTAFPLRDGFLNLKTGKEKWSFSTPSNSGMPYVYFFGPNGDKVKFW